MESPAATSSSKLPSVIELFVSSFNLYKTSWKLLALVILLPILATIVVIALVGVILATILAVTGGQITSSRIPLLIPPALVAVVALAIINAMGKISLVKAIQNNGQGKIKQLIKSAWPLVGKYILLQLMVGLIVLVGFVLLIVPGILFMVWFLFSSLILVVEGTGGIPALKRSRYYVRGKFWKVLGRMAVLIIVVAVLAGVTSLVDNQTVNLVFQLISTFIIAPLATIYTFRLYQAVKVSA